MTTVHPASTAGKDYDPIRVCHVIGAMDRGGAETFIMNTFRAINRKKVIFDFVVHENRQCDYDQEIQELGGRIFRLPRYTITNSKPYRKACQELFQKHPEWKIVHGHIGSCAPIYLDEAKQHGAYTIAHSHAQNYPLSLQEIAFRAVARPVRYISDYFIACSKQAGLDRFGKKIVDGDKFSILLNGIDTNQYRYNATARQAVRESICASPSTTVIGHVGRLTPVKNHPFLFEVFASFHRHNPDSLLILLGKGEAEFNLRDKVTAMGLENSICFLGVHQNVNDYLSAMDGFVFPSLREGLPLSCVEAQTSGLPCLISTGVSPEVVCASNAEMLPLSSGAEIWAMELGKAIEAAQHKNRNEARREVESSGFDIHSSAKWLESFYVSHATKQ